MSVKQIKSIKEYLQNKKSIKSYIICESQLTKNKIKEVKEFLMNYYHTNTWEDCINAQTYGDCQKMCKKIIQKFPNYFDKMALNIYFDFSDIAQKLIHDDKPMNGNHYLLTKGGKIYDFTRGCNCINGIYTLTQKEDNSDKYDIIFTETEKELINTIVKIPL